jgi:hypothetical protein
MSGPKVVQVQELWGDYFIKTGDNSFRWLILKARRELDPLTGDVLNQEAWVLKGKCTGPTPIDSDCSARGHKARILTFVIADDFSHARLVVRDDDYTHRLKFTATSGSRQWPTIYNNECKATADAFTEAWNATATGVLYGHRVSTPDEPEGFSERMRESVYAEGCP